jgi:hypothetical protein
VFYDRVVARASICKEDHTLWTIAVILIVLWLVIQGL